MWLSRLVREAQKTKKEFLYLLKKEKQKLQNTSKKEKENREQLSRTRRSKDPVQSRRFFFSLPIDFLFPAETRRYSADTIRFGPNRRKSVRFGANRRASEPNRRESASIWAALARVGKSTWHDAARTHGLRRPSRVAASRRVKRGCVGSEAASVHPRYWCSITFLIS